MDDPTEGTLHPSESMGFKSITFKNSAAYLKPKELPGVFLFQDTAQICNIHCSGKKFPPST